MFAILFVEFTFNRSRYGYSIIFESASSSARIGDMPRNINHGEKGYCVHRGTLGFAILRYWSIFHALRSQNLRDGGISGV